MSEEPRRLKEAKSREGMRQVNVWLPEAMHHALALVRVQDGVAMGEAVREALKLWLAQRGAVRRRGRKP